MTGTDYKRSDMVFDTTETDYYHPFGGITGPLWYLSVVEILYKSLLKVQKRIILTIFMANAYFKGFFDKSSSPNCPIGKTRGIRKNH